MAKPRLIILVRHAQSEGNKNREIHQSVPDHRVKLTPDGWAQAHEAGRRLRNLLLPDDTLQIFTSPYRRTRETTEGLLTTLTSDDPEPSPFRRSNITVYEEPRLREQDFGNFQPCSAEMERMWQERADYGHFFYRIPNGESAADAYDRVSGFNESLWRQFGDDDFPSVCILVTHGLMSRVFLMKWYHFSVEYFEDLRNVDHCEFLIMRKQENGKYHLENNLRTWSELRKERALSSKEKGGTEKVDTKLERNRTFVVTRRWGGCPNGCNHTSHYKKRHDLEALRQTDNERSSHENAANGAIPAAPACRKHRHKSNISIGDEGDDENSDHPRSRASEIQILRSADDIVSQGGISSPITAEDRSRNLKLSHLHVGRDGGGTYSGHASAAGTDSDTSSDEGQRRHHLTMRTKKSHVDAGKASATDNKRRDEIVSVGAFANRLGDAPAGTSDMEDIDRAEAEDRSIRGSVY